MTFIYYKKKSSVPFFVWLSFKVKKTQGRHSSSVHANLFSNVNCGNALPRSAPLSLDWGRKKVVFFFLPFSKTAQLAFHIFLSGNKLWNILRCKHLLSSFVKTVHRCKGSLMATRKWLFFYTCAVHLTCATGYWRFCSDRSASQFGALCLEKCGCHNFDITDVIFRVFSDFFGGSPLTFLSFLFLSAMCKRDMLSDLILLHALHASPSASVEI